MTQDPEVPVLPSPKAEAVVIAPEGSDAETPAVEQPAIEVSSLTLMDLCVALEERYDFVIEPADVMKQATVQNLARFIEEKRPKAS